MPQVGFEPQHPAYHADALPAEPPRQPSWAGRIFKGKGVSPLLGRVTLNLVLRTVRLYMYM